MIGSDFEVVRCCCWNHGAEKRHRGARLATLDYGEFGINVETVAVAGFVCAGGNGGLIC